MTGPSVSSRRWLVLVIGVSYVVIGAGTSALAGASPRATTFWRLAAWVLSLIAFLLHVWYDRRTWTSATSTAAHVAAAVALGAFLLAAVGPVRTHWGDAHFGRVALLSLVAWPVITGVPAFVAAFVAASALARVAPSDHPQSSNPSAY